MLNLGERLRVQQCRYSYAELERVRDRLSAEDWDLTDVDERGRPAISGLSIDQRAGVVRVRVQNDRPDISARLAAKYGLRIEVEEGDWLNVAFT